jgi:REP element-mobilizing transposase RayT
LIPARNYPIRKNIRLPRVEYRQGHIFFITIGTYRWYPWFRLYPRLCDVCIQKFKELSSARSSLLYAWSIMPDHIHLLVEDEDIIEFVRLFKGRMTTYSRREENQRKLWQRSFYDHALRQEESVYRVALYIWENPVRANIVDEPYEYEWSGSEVWPNFRGFYQ